MLRLTILPIILLTATACVNPTAYEPAVDRYGYAEQPIEDDRFRVTFSGNSSTPRETVENYLLLRAAEVTLDEGKDWFKIANRATEPKTRYQSHFSSVGRFGHFGFRRGSRIFLTTNDGFNGRPITRYEAFADITLHEGDKPQDDPDAYDARSVKDTLGPTAVTEKTQ